MCVYKITPMHSCTYKMQPIYYIAPYTAFLIATKLNQCYGGNAKPIAHTRFLHSNQMHYHPRMAGKETGRKNNMCCRRVRDQHVPAYKSSDAPLRGEPMAQRSGPAP